MLIDTGYSPQKSQKQMSRIKHEVYGKQLGTCLLEDLKLLTLFKNKNKPAKTWKISYEWNYNY